MRWRRLTFSRKPSGCRTRRFRRHESLRILLKHSNAIQIMGEHMTIRSKRMRLRHVGSE